PTVVHRELRSGVAEAPARAMDQTGAGGHVRFNDDQRRLNNEIGIQDQRFRMAVDEIGAIGDGVFVSVDLVTDSNTQSKHTEILWVEDKAGGRRSCRTKGQFSLMLEASEQRQIGSMGRN